MAVRRHRRLFIYLTPEGSYPPSRQFIPMGYSTVIRVPDDVRSSATDSGQLAIDQYTKCLKGRIVVREKDCGAPHTPWADPATSVAAGNPTV
jgi:hypothetical protein